MIYVLFEGSRIIGISSENPFDGKGGFVIVTGKNDTVPTSVQSRWDWKTFEEVSSIARYVTAMTGQPYLPVDNGGHVSPRFDIVLAPQIGDKVSYGFNGDYYPDGEVVKISKTYQITTSTGRTYRRQGSTARWMQPGGTWGLVNGHISEQNPSF